jgi:hypothetical protein
MNGSILVKDLRIGFRNRYVTASIGAVILLELIVTFYAREAYNSISDGSPGLQFNFMKNYFIILTFPLISANIITVLALFKTEKNAFQTARLVPNGESLFIRSKALSGIIISCLLVFPFIFSQAFISDLTFFKNLSVNSFMFFFWLFIISGLSFLSVSFAVSYFYKNGYFDPDFKAVLIFLLMLTTVSVFFFSYGSGFLWFYYDYVMGFSVKYPYSENLKTLLSAFSFMVASRFVLQSAINKFLRKN